MSENETKKWIGIQAVFKTAEERDSVKEALRAAGLTATQVLLDFAKDYKRSPAYINKLKAALKELQELGVKI